MVTSWHRVARVDCVERWSSRRQTDCVSCNTPRP